MPNLNAIIFDVPNDKVTAAWSSDGTVNALYPLTNIDDGKAWNPVIFTANPTRIVADHGAAAALAIVSFIHCNFPAGYDLHVQRGNVIGTPLQDVAVVCPGPTPSGFPSNPFADMTGAGAGSYRYTWLELPTTATLLSLGLVRLTGTKRQVERNVTWGVKASKTFPTNEQETDGDVQLGYSRGTRTRMVGGAMATTDAGFAALDAAFEACLGRFKPFLFILDPTINEAMWVKWGANAQASFERTYAFLDLNALPIDVEEVGRGLRP